ncbi:glycosyltransferase family 4 protein [Synechococcus sp. ROS8604]|uniref:glycosyltransferase family 4 protein n=1 Tax=Synechococcus sp. ROS8604 TaxID=1442557 RepID=UPI0016463FC8|nr:glycosyltransferase family 4 protein [Synechococcus sp. ROS8604]QNI86958.1 conserved hypothetical protein distantly related to alpha-glycosyltransferases family 4 [Synechococcus sp. ROS8604]
MKIISLSIASTMRFHYDKLAIQLFSLHSFQKWYTFLSEKKVSIIIKDRLHTVSSLGLFINLLGRKLIHLSPRFAVTLKGLGDSIFDLEVLINLVFRSNCNVLIGLSNNITWSGFYIKSKGGKFILDVPIAHPLYMNKVLCDEFKKYNLSYFNHCSFHITRIQKSLSIADHIVCPSEFVKSSLVENEVDPKKITIIPYGCSKVSKNKTCKKYTSVNDQFNILFVGQLSIRKGLPYLLKAFTDLDIKNKHLYLIGANVSETDSLLSNIDLTDISILGQCDKETLHSYYQTSNVFVLPSLIEGLALVIGEAISYGLPIIYTFETGGTNLLTNNINGLLVRSKSSIEIESAIKVLAANPDFRKKISDNNFKLASQLHGWDTYGESWRELLYSM